MLAECLHLISLSEDKEFFFQHNLVEQDAYQLSDTRCL